MPFFKITGAITFSVGLVLSVTTLYFFLDELLNHGQWQGLFDFFLEDDHIFFIPLLIYSGLSVYFPLANHFDKGFVDKTELYRIKKENEILELNIRQIELQDKLQNE